MFRLGYKSVIRNIQGIRYLSTKPTIGQPFKSQQELSNYLSNPQSNWSIQELLSNAGPEIISKRADGITRKTVDKMLKLSGLQANPEEYDELIQILKSQVMFIDHLHAVPELEVKAGQVGKPLGLNEIYEQIEQLEGSEDKGELENWDPLSLTNDSLNGQYIIKEGLIKNK
ncbi:hypothetical protein BN7_2720 [Wickerhamomyces ciferrii]|uniref:Glu-AdT subunit F n=1 Tax=Wickerhamomyces ciferrii (strain ATCC 14091 / BCRC 22168 / CBS 111 / JCM 3599 / NBRC 0793 / NRRL Y-1031 F-60-10) TaxID=1206466 RepID=K0KPS8_WICCF|nr:uncharacterized protein BN7_2720 [Wickerhamomyces ciferrii]CCH43173.1 hypothetical protein BN7_2720 [Wickerhamomyces ciferrii]